MTHWLAARKHPYLILTAAWFAVTLWMTTASTDAEGYATWPGGVLVVLSGVAVCFVLMRLGSAVARRRAHDRRREFERLCFDADYQHGSLMSGDVQTGAFGRYPPTKEA